MRTLCEDYSLLQSNSSASGVLVLVAAALRCAWKGQC